MVSIGLPPSQVPAQQVNNEVLDMIGVNTAKVTSLCEKVQGELVTLGAEPEICTIFVRQLGVLTTHKSDWRRVSVILQLPW